MQKRAIGNYKNIRKMRILKYEIIDNWKPRFYEP